MKLVRAFAFGAVAAACHLSPAQAAVRTGYIALSGTSSPGYVSSTYALYGEYGFASSLAGAALVQFDDAAPLFSVTVLNNATSGGYDYLGVIRGYGDVGDDLAPGSFNYAYLGGTSYTAPGTIGTDNATAFTAITGSQQPYQSSVWSIAGDTLSLSYLNSGGSTVGVTGAFYTPDGVLLATADPAAFTDRFGGPSPTVIFTFVATDVPEPASWAMMVGGFGLVGAALRRRQRATVRFA